MTDYVVVVGDGDIPAAGCPEAAQVLGGAGGIGITAGAGTGRTVGWHPMVRGVRGMSFTRSKKG